MTYLHGVVVRGICMPRALKIVSADLSEGPGNTESQDAVDYVNKNHKPE